jgi:hypothetical protein
MLCSAQSNGAKPLVAALGRVTADRLDSRRHDSAEAAESSVSVFGRDMFRLSKVSTWGWRNSDGTQLNSEFTVVPINPLCTSSSMSGFAGNPRVRGLTFQLDRV